jgi:hypothetical protein
VLSAARWQDQTLATSLVEVEVGKCNNCAYRYCKLIMAAAGVRQQGVRQQGVQGGCVETPPRRRHRRDTGEENKIVQRSSSFFCFVVSMARQSCRSGATPPPRQHQRFSLHPLRRYYLAESSIGDGRWNRRPAAVIICLAARDVCGDGIVLCGKERPKHNKYLSLFAACDGVAAPAYQALFRA